MASRGNISIIVPAYREVDNLPTLTARVFAALQEAELSGELIIVDDNSQDGTEEAVGALATAHRVRLIVRRDERGLSSAVLCGYGEAKHDILVVMDADLQHPPELIPALVAPLMAAADRPADACDFAIGTRYAPGGEIVEAWPWHRRLASKAASLLAWPLTPLSDPMSGFFAIPRSTLERAAPLSPIGFKIALEVYVKAGCRHPKETPIRFDTRNAGESKLGGRESLRYLRHLVSLYAYASPWLLWLMVGFGVFLSGALLYWIVT